MKYSHLLFDLDNTLLNFSTASLEALKDIAKALQLEYNNEFLDVYHDINHGVWMEFESGIITAVELRKKRFEETAKYFKRTVDGNLLNRKYVKGVIANGNFMPGAKELLAAVHPNYSLSIITNGLKEAQRPRLKEAGIYELFEEIVVSDEIGFAKPDSKYFEYAWERLQRPEKSKVLVIGDSPNSDIKGGNGFGFDTCLYDPSQKHQGHSASLSVSNLSELQTKLSL